MLRGRPAWGPWVVAAVTDMLETLPGTPELPLLPPHPPTATTSINAPATSIHGRGRSLGANIARLTMIVRVSQGTVVECAFGFVFRESAAKAILGENIEGKFIALLPEIVPVMVKSSVAPTASERGGEKVNRFDPAGGDGFPVPVCPFALRVNAEKILGLLNETVTELIDSAAFVWLVAANSVLTCAPGPPVSLT